MGAQSLMLYLSFRRGNQELPTNLHVKIYYETHIDYSLRKPIILIYDDIPCLPEFRRPCPPCWAWRPPRRRSRHPATQPSSSPTVGQQLNQ